ncbi:MAG: hypothetical protein GDA49_01515 [Rhodospirillales bacterium]|nr:hypothetical protein [Rhodospirillales bacterium]
MPITRDNTEDRTSLPYRTPLRQGLGLTPLAGVDAMGQRIVRIRQTARRDERS